MKEKDGIFYDYAFSGKDEILCRESNKKKKEELLKDLKVFHTYHKEPWIFDPTPEDIKNNDLVYVIHYGKETYYEIIKAPDYLSEIQLALLVTDLTFGYRGDRNCISSYDYS